MHRATQWPSIILNTVQMEKPAVLALKKREKKRETETLIVGSFPENPRTSANKKEKLGIMHV